MVVLLCRSPRKENVYAQTQQDTLARLAATYGKHILCRRTLRTGATWGFHRGGMGASAVEVVGTIISSRTTGLGMSTVYPHFHGGIVFDVSPLWIAPAPYIGVTPAPHPRRHLCGTTAQTHQAIIL